LVVFDDQERLETERQHPSGGTDWEKGEEDRVDVDGDSNPDPDYDYDEDDDDELESDRERFPRKDPSSEQPEQEADHDPNPRKNPQFHSLSNFRQVLEWNFDAFESRVAFDPHFDIDDIGQETYKDKEAGESEMSSSRCLHTPSSWCSGRTRWPT
jgi:hypothetical protein